MFHGSMLSVWLLHGVLLALHVNAAPLQVSLVYKHKVGSEFVKAGEVTSSLHDGQVCKPPGALALPLFPPPLPLRSLSAPHWALLADCVLDARRHHDVSSNHLQFELH